MLEIRNLKKYFLSYWLYRKLHAVRDVSLTVNDGEVFGLLGHNGAGKTTIIKCIVGLLRPNAGVLEFDSQSLNNSHVRASLGLLTENPYFYDHLSVTETLDFLASLYGLDRSLRKQRVGETLDLVGLSNKSKARVNQLSKGLQQRLGLAQAIIHNPRLLILDEPFTGLDPMGRRDVKQIIRDLSSRGTTILLSSHILSDVEELCDRVAVIAHGEVLKVFDLACEKEQFRKGFRLEISDLHQLDQLKQEMHQMAEEIITEGTKNTNAELHFKNYTQASEALQKTLAAGGEVVCFEPLVVSLEEMFIEITERDRSSRMKSALQQSVAQGGEA